MREFSSGSANICRAPSPPACNPALGSQTRRLPLLRPWPAARLEGVHLILGGCATPSRQCLLYPELGGCLSKLAAGVEAKVVTQRPPPAKICLLLPLAAAGSTQGLEGSHWQSHLCVAEPNKAACHTDDLQRHLRTHVGNGARQTSAGKLSGPAFCFFKQPAPGSAHLFQQGLWPCSADMC